MSKETWVYPYLGFTNDVINLFMIKIYIMLTCLTFIVMNEFGYFKGINIYNLISMEFRLSIVITIIYLLNVLGKVFWNAGVWLYNYKKGGIE